MNVKNIYKNNALFSLLFACLLALPNLGAGNDISPKELQSPTTKKSNASSIVNITQGSNPSTEVRYGWFFSAGLGIGAQRLQSNHAYFTKPEAVLKRRFFANYDLSLKIGGYVYLNPYVAIRSYVGYELYLNPITRSSSDNFLMQSHNYYLSYRLATLNLDFIFNAYTSQKIDFGFILGGGMDSVLLQLGTRKGNIFDHSSSKINRIQTEPHLKFGMRTMIDKEWGIELITKMPLFYHYTALGNVLSTMGTISTTLNFVMEL